MKSVFSSDPFFEDKKTTRKPRQLFTPESFTRYRFNPESGTPTLIQPPSRGPRPKPFSESQTQFQLHCDSTGKATTIQRSSIIAYYAKEEPTAGGSPDDLPPGTIPLTQFTDYALCPANGALFRYRSPSRGLWPKDSRKRIQGRRHAKWAQHSPEYFRLLHDGSGAYRSLPFETVLALAGLTTRTFSQKFKGSTFFVDGVPMI